MGAFSRKNQVLWSGGSDGLVRVEMQADDSGNQAFACRIRSLALLSDSLIYGGGPVQGDFYPVLPFQQNHLRFTYAAPEGHGQQAIRYQYQLEGFDPDWSAWSESPEKEYTNLPEGVYSFRVRARNIYDRISEEARLEFRVLPPWYRSLWAYVGYTLVLGGLFFLALTWRSRKLMAEKEALEKIVAERTEEVASQARRLRELDQLKSRFFANISHEFRTPLTLILGPLSDRLQHLSPDDPQGATDRMMHQQADRLLGLVNQLLALSQIEAGSVQVLPERGDVRVHLGRVFRSFDSMAAEKDIAYELSLPETSWMIWYDWDKLEKILYNLLSNAFKFAPTEAEVQARAAFFRKKTALPSRYSIVEAISPRRNRQPSLIAFSSGNRTAFKAPALGWRWCRNY